MIQETRDWNQGQTGRSPILLAENGDSPVCPWFPLMIEFPSTGEVADFSVTVSSNEAQHILIQKSLTQQVLFVISPAG